MNLYRVYEPESRIMIKNKITMRNYVAIVHFHHGSNWKLEKFFKEELNLDAFTNIFEVTDREIPRLVAQKTKEREYVVLRPPAPFSRESAESIREYINFLREIEKMYNIKLVVITDVKEERGKEGIVRGVIKNYLNSRKIPYHEVPWRRLEKYYK